MRTTDGIRGSAWSGEGEVAGEGSKDGAGEEFGDGEKMLSISISVCFLLLLE